MSDSPEGISTSSLENFVNCTSGISSCSSHDNEAYKLLTNCSANNGLSPQECHVLNSVRFCLEFLSQAVIEIRLNYW